MKRGKLLVMTADHLLYLSRINLRPSTRYQRGRVLERFAEHLAHRNWQEVTAAAILDFLDRPSLSTEAKATELSHLRGFFKWAVEEGRVAEDPTAKLRRPKMPRRLPRPISDADLRRAIDEAPNPRIRAALLLACQAGLRACEIAQLDGRHVRWDSEPPMLEIRVGKGGGSSTVPLNPTLVDLAKTLPVSGPWFPRLDYQPGPVPAHRVSQDVNK